MFADERYSIIIKLLKEKGAVTVSDLMGRFSVSIETVRRDLQYLEQRGHLNRVHGGAVAPARLKSFPELPKRVDQNRDKKRELSQTAAALVQEGDIIALDTGSTAIEFVQALKETVSRLTVVTHSLDVISLLKDHTSYRLIGVCGQYLHKEAAFYGPLAMQTLSRLRFSKAFIFPSAISFENGIQDYVPEMTDLQKQYISRAERVVVLADSSKFERNAFLKLADLDPSYLYVTDGGLKDDILQLYRENNITLYTSAEQIKKKKR